MSKDSNYLIFKQESPYSSTPYCVAEFIMTLDGPRTRISRMGFTTQAEAQDFINSHKPQEDAK